MSTQICWSRLQTLLVCLQYSPQYIQFVLSQLQTLLDRLVRALKIQLLLLHFTTLILIVLPYVTKWVKGSGTLRVIGIQKVQRNIPWHWETRT